MRRQAVVLSNVQQEAEDRIRRKFLERTLGDAVKGIPTAAGVNTWRVVAFLALDSIRRPAAAASVRPGCRPKLHISSGVAECLVSTNYKREQLAAHCEYLREVLVI